MIFLAAEDIATVQKASQGDVVANSDVMSRWEKPVYNYLQRFTENRADSLDLTQEVLLKVYQKLGTLKNPSQFASWLHRIAHNEACSMFRRRRRESGWGRIDQESVDYEIMAGSNSVFPLELRLAVAAALDRLPHNQRKVIALKIYEGFNFTQIAKILSCPVSTIKSRFYSALDILKSELAPIKSSDSCH